MDTTEALTKLVVNKAKRAALIDMLESSLKLEELLPDAFEHGRCRIGGYAPGREPHKGHVTFTRGDGSQKVLPALEVPFSLWPTGMQDDFNELPAHVRRRIKLKE